MRVGSKAVVFLIVSFLPVAAWAQSCNFSISALNFGQVDTLSGAQSTSSATLNVSCSGTPLARILVCPNIGSGSGGATAAARQMLNGTSPLNFQLYSDSAQNLVWGSYTWPYPARPPALAVTLGALGSATGSSVIYGSVPGGQGTAPPGSYLSSFSGNNTEFRYRYTTSSDCSTLTGTVARPSFNVTASVAANCRVSTQTVDFGTTGVLSSNVDATGQVSVSCTPGANYSISLDNGQTGTGPTSRRMTLGSIGITYGLYRDTARSLPWGSTVGTNTVAGTGTGVAVGIPVYGRVPSQTTPAPGTYTDTVVVTVTY
jgi:spore coat protein U-like protein